MKKFIALTLALSMTFSLVACGSTGDSSTPPPPVASSSAGASSSVATDPVDELWLPFNADGSMKLTERDAVGENGIVTSANAYATMAGIEILEAGGNAVDAAVAVSYAIGVVEPFASGLGGGGFMIIRSAEGETTVIDYREVAASAQTDQSWLNEAGELIYPQANSRGGLANAIPGTVAGMEYALEAFGSGVVTREEIMQPAITLASEGYAVGATMANQIADGYTDMVGDYTDLGAYYISDTGLPYETGNILKNPDLAKSLQIIADQGVDGFYAGEMAEATVAASQNAGGLMTTEDLASYEVSVRTPVSSTYRGYQIIAPPPPSSGGTHLIEILNILETYDIAALDVNSAEYVHLFSEAFKIAFADRSAYMADTDFAPDVPLDGLTSKEYAEERSSQVTNESQDWTAGNPYDYGHDSTTSFSIADKEGNMVTVTQTIECFWGSKVAVPGYGFILNDEMHDFSTNPESVNNVEGGKKPLSSMTPTIVLNADGTPFMTLGSPGGTRIFPTVVQIISHVIDHDMGIQEAIDTARIYDNGNDDGVCYESGGNLPITPEVAAELEAMGHTVTDKGEWQMFFGGVQGILYADDGNLYGGADPRRDGKALGY